MSDFVPAKIVTSLISTHEAGDPHNCLFVYLFQSTFVIGTPDKSSTGYPDPPCDFKKGRVQGQRRELNY